MTRADPGYRTALLDWLACAAAGRHQSASRAAGAAGEGVLGTAMTLGTAGHVLDFDDTYLPGLCHLSAATAPAALALGSELGASVGGVLEAYAAGFEAVAAVARASHPALYDGGWHPTAVCGVVGSATACAHLLGLDRERERTAVRLALLSASGLRAAFGSDGKSLQVGTAAANGLLAARLAAAGAGVRPDLPTAPAGFDEAFGATFAEPGDEPAVGDNWIKAYPCCLKAHSAIEAAARLRAYGDPRQDPITVTVHPRARAAASYDEVADGLEAKFSIPYLTAYTLLHGEPTVMSFESVDVAARVLAADRVRVRTDPALLDSEAVLQAGDGAPIRVEAALGSPSRPMTEEQLTTKLHSLAGTALHAALDDPARPARGLLEAVG